MQIEILKVDVTQATNTKGKSYNVAEVAYKNLDNGKVEGKKIVDFANKEVFGILSGAKSGTVFFVTAVKNEKSGYWDWAELTPASGAPASGPAKASPAPKSNYETPEERAAKQVFIVRQSSVSSAIALLKTDKNVPKIEEVIDVAKVIENYVFGKEAKTAEPGFDDFEDDVPL